MSPRTVSGIFVVVTWWSGHFWLVCFWPLVLLCIETLKKQSFKVIYDPFLNPRIPVYGWKEKRRKVTKYLALIHFLSHDLYFQGKGGKEITVCRNLARCRPFKMLLLKVVLTEVFNSHWLQADQRGVNVCISFIKGLSKMSLGFWLHWHEVGMCSLQLISTLSWLMQICDFDLGNCHVLSSFLSRWLQKNANSF